MLTATTVVQALEGMNLPSGTVPGVIYRVERQIGEGAMGVALFALRHAVDGVSPVVLKVIRPEVVQGDAAKALMIVRKEVVALSRLNERVPPTPFVVRYVDTGSVHLGRAGLELPWVAVEYVHGGADGSTLGERVAYSVDRTGYGFDIGRAAHALRCLGYGLEAIHEVGVVHRDLKPENVLCCGFGEAELFKISDFGIARPQGLAGTLADTGLGTLGYAPPEQSDRGTVPIGPATDVFSLACVAFTILTGEDYFDVRSIGEALFAVRRPERRRLSDAAHLCPELRERVDSCRSIDAALVRATAFDPRERQQSARELSAGLLPFLEEGPQSVRAHPRLLRSMMGRSSSSGSYAWTVRHPPGSDRIVQSAAWDAEGHCLAATTLGLEFWNGSSWARGEVADLPTGPVRIVRPVRAGEWLVATADGALCICSTGGVREVVRMPEGWTLDDASGDFGDLLVAVARKGGSPALLAMAARRWMRALPLTGVAAVTSLARIDDSRWLVVGRAEEGRGFVCVYEPMMWELTPLAVPPTRAYVSSAAQPERQTALIAGRDGVVVKVVNFETRELPRVEGNPDLSASAIDILDGEWVTSAARLWLRDRGGSDPWRCVWHDAHWPVPFVSMMADVGRVVALGVDGSVLEGKTKPRGR